MEAELRVQHSSASGHQASLGSASWLCLGTLTKSSRQPHYASVEMTSRYQNEMRLFKCKTIAVLVQCENETNSV